MILINPPWNTKYPQPPLGLASLAAVIENSGHQIKILDANALCISKEKVADLVKREEIIGLTAMTPIVNSAIGMARMIKQENPDSKIILGGPHATNHPTDILRNVKEIDIIVRGEGEATIVELLEKLEKNRLNEVRGISYRNESRIIENPSRPLIIDLDSLPFLAYHLLPISKYKLHPPHGRRSPVMAMLTSRGCPYNCVFCSKSVFGSNWRGQSPKRILEEISYIKEKFRIKEIVFYDDSFTLKRKRIFELAEEIKNRNMDMPWTCETRVNLVDLEMLSAMKSAGCYMIAYGIESGDPSILATLRKNITKEQIESAVEMTQKVGIQSIGYFMIGSPGETNATIRKTIDFAKNLSLDFAQFSVTIPFPGTDLYNVYFDKLDKNILWDDFIYARIGSAGTPVFESKELSKGQLKNWNKIAYGEFYLRFSYIWKRFIKMRSAGDFKTNLIGLRMFLDMRGEK
ncbi:tRNA-2-methylthio-N(6)-dimethylallyladenosine synthase [uncultured archaeon]|nr:tRNA-2-methylthio-N(6)-dimethylallyladenosine synthase [uncultured archaeon]